MTSAEKAAEEIAHVQKELKTKASEVNSLHEKLQNRDQQISVRQSGLFVRMSELGYLFFFAG